MGRANAAVHKLGAFVREVRALEGKKTPPDVASMLIRDALLIMEFDGQ